MTAARESAAPAAPGRLDAAADVVVVGGGGGGLPAALFSRWLGNEVVLLEKAPELGGTARKAAFWYWVPNNAALRASGGEDRQEDFLRYVARLSAPDRYDPAGPTLGLTEWEHASFRAIYESASPAAELLRERGALPYRHVPDACDYWSELPEDRSPTGRVLIHEDANESMSDGGLVSIASMEARARADGVDIRTGHRVQRVMIGRRRGRRRRGDDGRRRRRARRRAQGRDLRHRRLHARPGAASRVPWAPGDRRLRGAHQRGRLRPHRRRRRRGAARDVGGVDVPDPARARRVRRPGPVGHVLGRRRLDDLRRRARAPRGQREAPSTTSSPSASSSGTERPASIPTAC